MSRFIAAFAVSLSLCLAAPQAAFAGDDLEGNIHKEMKKAEEHLKRAGDEVRKKLMELGRAFDEALEKAYPYAKPEVTPEGDIILRRRVPKESPKPKTPRSREGEVKDISV